MRRGSQLTVTVTGSQGQRFCAVHRLYRFCATAPVDSLTYKREITRYFACALTAQGPLEVEGPWAIAHMVNPALLLPDVTQAKQTPNLQWQSNRDSSATSRPVCKSWYCLQPDGATAGTANHTRNGRANRGACGQSKLRETGFSLSGRFPRGPSASVKLILDGKNRRGPKRAFDKVQGTCPLTK